MTNSVRQYLDQCDQRAFRALVARGKLEAGGVPLGGDFHALTSAQVDALVTLADADKYRQPRHANGSRARYYHARLQRMAGA